MQIQKGLVKYKDRSDILCTYGITDEGKTYYFLEGNTISNGNIVATTVLVEAIDPLVISSSIGVISPNGDVIIPFENKSIKVIANDLLLVEKSTPVTESVIEAIELRRDPQAASRLVTTPAVIKENMNAKMGNDGRFVFNDQFSEATICDIDGHNLVNNELYSFVGVTADKLYLSKNTPESFISEFSLESKKLVLTPEMGDPMLDIGNGDASEFTVDLDTIQQNAEQAAIDADAATTAAANAAAVAMQEDEAIRNAPSEENTESGFKPGDITAENFEAFAANVPVVEPAENVENVTAENVSNVTAEDVKEVVENVVFEEKTETIEDAIPEGKEEVSEEVPTMPSAVSEDVSLESEDIKPSNDLFNEQFISDIFADSTLKEDSIVTMSDEHENSFGLSYMPGHAPKDNLIHEITTTVTDLVSVNRNQRDKIIVLEERIAQLTESNRMLTDKTRDQARDYEKLKSSVENYRTVVSKLEAKNGALESKCRDQERTILRLNEDNKKLREELLNNEALAQVLADARSALSSGSDYDSSSDIGYYRRVA